MVPTVQARPCSNTTTAGAWGFTSTGTFLFPSQSGPVLVPLVNVGIFTADEAGNFVGSQTRNVGGVLADETITGSLSVNPDCTGTLIARASDASSGAPIGTAITKIVLDHNGRQLQALITEELDSHGNSIRGDVSTAGEKVFAKDEEDFARDDEDGCTLATLKGSWGVTINGTVIGFGPIAVVGLVKFDGEGHFSIDATSDIGGNVFPDQATGTSTVNDNCTGTGLDSNGDRTKFVVVGDRNNKEIIGIEIAPSTILNTGVVATLRLEKQ
jgi:hypothetical protein